MSKPTPEQIKKQKLEWIADYKESVETGKPMREWECQYVVGRWYRIGNVRMLDDYECRRERELCTFYWCVLKGVGGAVWVERRDKEEDLKRAVREAPMYLQQLTPIKKETVELTQE